MTLGNSPRLTSPLSTSPAAFEVAGVDGPQICANVRRREGGVGSLVTLPDSNLTVGTGEEITSR